MLVKILIDNVSKNELVCEWGLAVYIEYKGHHFLLNTVSCPMLILIMQTGWQLFLEKMTGHLSI